MADVQTTKKRRKRRKMENGYVEYRYSSGEPTHDDSFLWNKVAEILARHTLAKQRVFEIGCGNGLTAHRLANLGYEVMGVDPSKTGIAHARRKYPEARLFEGSIDDDLAEKYGRFPVLISLEVIEHCYDPRKFVRRVSELLEPGGIGIISTPYHGYWKNLALAILGRFDKHFSPLWDCGHIKFFSIKTLSELLCEADFEQLRIYRAGRIPTFAKSMVAVFRKSTEHSTPSKTAIRI
jgi:2-polyprenyl-3-methyl-5-hydroxy-6-metoxy-1,4-benzoquinol methylase